MAVIAGRDRRGQVVHSIGALRIAWLDGLKQSASQGRMYQNSADMV
jgi:hypothetical protein